MSSEEKESKGINKLEDLVGEFGPWQRNLFLISFINLMPISWQILVPTFFTPEIDHWCSPPPAYWNLTANQWKSLAIPQITSENNTVIYSSCLMYKTITDSPSEREYSNVTCTSWEYDNSFYASTIIDEIRSPSCYTTGCCYLISSRHRVCFLAVIYCVQHIKVFIYIWSYVSNIFFVHLKFLPESLRWLLTQDKEKQAERELKRALILNKKQVSNLEDVVKQLMNKANKEENDASRKKATFVDLLLTPNMRKKTLNLYFIWFVLAFVYYGLSLNTNNLGGNPFLNFFIAGAVEFPSYGASVFAIKYLGRRISGMSTMVIAGLACVLTIPIPDDLLSLRITVSMIGKAFISGAFGIMIVYSSEIFPTVVRNVGVGSSSTFARIGSMVAPFAVKELGKVTNPRVPLGIFGGFSIFAGLLILLLPETNNKPLSDTLEEGEDFGKKHSAKVSPLEKQIVFSTKL
ncbi:organic cation transporter protein-like isoform X2 [Limulus polyphemus]|uniref:Organic cation transporter protein-like isoform X2 n=1 Tax=Limulus polyphemus TaxID=6850 RepID=A0ABM1S0D0_LIMPO|nr:organic cation transporter protein-like isoform X2 [Limulus polyphemus]